MPTLSIPRRLAHFSAGAAVVVLFVALLAACGGGGGGGGGLASAPAIDTPAPPVVMPQPQPTNPPVTVTMTNPNPQPPAPPVALPRDFAAPQAGLVANGNASRQVITELPAEAGDGMVSIAVAGVTATGVHLSYFLSGREVSYRAYMEWVIRYGGLYRAPSPVTLTLSTGFAEHSLAISVIGTTAPGAEISRFAVITAMGPSANISGNLHIATTGLHNIRLPLAEGVHIVHSHYDCLHSTIDCYRHLRGNGRQGDEASGQAAELTFVNHVANNDVAYIWAALPTQTNTRAAGFWASAPRAFPQLRGKWIVAAAANVVPATVGSNVNLFAALRDRRASCFGIGDWCLVANAETPHEAAAKTSGALALLKQRSYDAPMSVLVNILLATADEVRGGARNTDPALELFGRGILNPEAAMAAADNMQTAEGLPLTKAGVNLPPLMGGLAKALSEESIAVRYLHNRYYDHPLAGFVRAENAPPLRLDSDDIWDRRDTTYDERFFAVHDGGGKLRAAGMRLGALEFRHSQYSAPSALTSGENMLPFFAANGGDDMQMRMHFGGGFSGFAANGDAYWQSGFLFERDFGRIGFASSFSRINENNTLFGGRWDGIAQLSRGGESMQARAKMSFAAGEQWTLFAAAEQARTKAKTGGIIARIDGLRAFGWQAGAAAKNIFRYGDRLRFGITRETSLSGGTAILHIRQSAPGGWQVVERPVSLASEKHHTIAAGYGFALSAKERWSFAAAHRIGGKSRIHLQWRLEF